MAMIILPMLAPSIEINQIARIKPGNARIKSITRIIQLSVLPPT
jgi:hypothetical protein